MATQKFPEPEWTDDEVAAVRRRGKKLALQQFQADPKSEEMAFSHEEALALMGSERMFADRTPRVRAAMSYELHDAAHRFAKELREVAE